jgi:CheY-like chemotaxis protein
MPSSTNSEPPKPALLFIEDDLPGIADFLDVLSERFEVIYGAANGIVFQQRSEPYRILILDLMINTETGSALDDNEAMLRRNIQFEGVDWTETGLEFLRRLRAGQFLDYGMPADIPVIVATARVDDATHRFARAKQVSSWLEKPFSIDELLGAIDGALASSQG